MNLYDYVKSVIIMSDIENTNKNTKEKKTILDEFLEWAEAFVFAIFIVILIFTFFIRIVVVKGNSMNDTLHDKERVIISHINYEPEQGDIAVINSRVLGEVIIKRVIGTAGDKVVVDYNTNTVTVNGQKIDNSYIKEPMEDYSQFDLSYKVSEKVYEYDVPENCIFVMGDNRNNSADSRMIGFINKSDVLGKAFFRMYPLNSAGKI